MAPFLCYQKYSGVATEPYGSSYGRPAETCWPRSPADEFEGDHGQSCIRFASTLQILCKQFLKECFLLFAIQFAKFAENFSDSAVLRVRAQTAADV